MREIINNNYSKYIKIALNETIGNYKCSEKNDSEIYFLIKNVIGLNQSEF